MTRCLPPVLLLLGVLGEGDKGEERPLLLLRLLMLMPEISRCWLLLPLLLLLPAAATRCCLSCWDWPVFIIPPAAAIGEGVQQARRTRERR